jgi:hypothetical protein
MNKQFLSLCEELKNDIKKSYEQGVGLDEAERLASKFLDAQMTIADHLRNTALDARMKKSGVKAVKAAVYMDAATKTEKKPSDAFLQALVDMNELVLGEQKSLDEAEIEVETLHNYFSIFKDAHIHFRSVAKGRFE